jgi:hypothetical protein
VRRLCLKQLSSKSRRKRSLKVKIAPEAFVDSVQLNDADDGLENSVNAVDELRAIKAPRPENGIPASLLREPARGSPIVGLYS